MHPYFVSMWFVSWLFGVIVISIIPLIIRLYVYYSNYIPLDYEAIQSLDIAFMGLAFNWTNITETTNIISSNKDVKNKNILLSILLASVIIIFGLALIILNLNENAILKKYDECDHNIRMLIPAILLTIVSLIMNIVVTILLKCTKDGKL